MTRSSSLVLEGSEIKLRLEAERLESGSLVHVDWLRFTLLLRNAPAPSVDVLFPPVAVTYDQYRDQEIARALSMLPDYDFSASAQAFALAQSVCECLGEGFVVHPEIRRGHDFYKFRWSILRGESECGWVGFLSSGDSPRQSAQSQTMHCNLYGAACTFAAFGWRDRVADLVQASNGVVTRCDLALDFFDGLAGALPGQSGMDLVALQYDNGLCNVGGRKLKSNCVGDWRNGRSRSLYFGSKEAGKQTNVYEKGDQLFGEPANSPWLRVELRYGNKLRVLPVDMLRRPADFFAGASDWHQSTLALAVAGVVPAEVPCEVRRPAETVKAEVVRNVRWLLDVAAPSVAAAWDFLGSDFLEVVTNKKLPGRLRKFSPKELQAAFSSSFRQYFPAGGGSLVPAFSA